MDFPPAPPTPSEVEADPASLKNLDSRILYDQEKRQFILAVSSEGKTEEYQYSFIVKQWILIKKHIMDDEELEEEANKEEIKRLKKQKLNSIRQEKEMLIEPSSSGIFISNLPETTIDELKSHFSKYGSIALDEGDSPRIKLYFDESKRFKHEALILYENSKSVDLAIQMAHQTLMRGRVIGVEVAKFKANHSEKLMDIKKKFYSKIVVIENMFQKTELETDEYLKSDIESDIKDECSKVGSDDVVKISLFPQDEMVTIKFRDPELATRLIDNLQSRFYDGNLLRAYRYDGKTYA